MPLIICYHGVVSLSLLPWPNALRSAEEFLQVLLTYEEQHLFIPIMVPFSYFHLGLVRENLLNITERPLKGSAGIPTESELQQQVVDIDNAQILLAETYSFYSSWFALVVPQWEPWRLSMISSSVVGSSWSVEDALSNTTVSFSSDNGSGKAQQLADGTRDAMMNEARVLMAATLEPMYMLHAMHPEVLGPSRQRIPEWALPFSANVRVGPYLSFEGSLVGFNDGSLTMGKSQFVSQMSATATSLPPPPTGQYSFYTSSSDSPVVLPYNVGYFSVPVERQQGFSFLTLGVGGAGQSFSFMSLGGGDNAEFGDSSSAGIKVNATISSAEFVVTSVGVTIPSSLGAAFAVEFSLRNVPLMAVTTDSSILLQGLPAFKLGESCSPFLGSCDPSRGFGACCSSNHVCKRHAMNSLCGADGAVVTKFLCVSRFNGQFSSLPTDVSPSPPQAQISPVDVRLFASSVICAPSFSVSAQSFTHYNAEVVVSNRDSAVVFAPLALVVQLRVSPLNATVSVPDPGCTVLFRNAGEVIASPTAVCLLEPLAANSSVTRSFRFTISSPVEANGGSFVLFAAPDFRVLQSGSYGPGECVARRSAAGGGQVFRFSIER